MMRLPRATAKEVEKALLRLGFTLSHSKGSHRSYKKESKRVIISFHSGKIIPPGTLKNILRQIGLTANEFNEYL